MDGLGVPGKPVGVPIFMISCAVTDPDANAADTDVKVIVPGLVRFGIQGDVSTRDPQGLFRDVLPDATEGSWQIVPLQVRVISRQVVRTEIPKRDGVVDPVDPEGINTCIDLRQDSPPAGNASERQFDVPFFDSILSLGLRYVANQRLSLSR